MTQITIHYDFTNGTELSYVEVMESLARNPLRTITTCCLDFFTTEHSAVLLRRNGSRMSVKQLLSNTDGFSTKRITRAHNLQKLLKAGHFTF